jgi:transposase InsO family protein
MSDHDQPVAANLLDRRFEADAPNQRWVSDRTELYIGATYAKLYLAVILDLFSRYVVGWAVSARQRPAPDHQGARHGVAPSLSRGWPAREGAAVRLAERRVSALLGC